MNLEEFQKLLIRGALAAMTCDGEIHPKEIDEIEALDRKTPYFDGLSFESELREASKQFLSDGAKAVDNFVKELKSTELRPGQHWQLMEVLILIILSDKRIDDSEVKFFKIVRDILDVSDETLIMKFPKFFQYVLHFDKPIDHISFEENLANVNTKYLNDESSNSR